MPLAALVFISQFIGNCHEERCGYSLTRNIAYVLHNDLSLATSETLLNVQNPHNIVETLEENIYGLFKTLEGKTR